MPYVLVDGAQIHYEVAGEGSPVVLLHGMGGQFERFKEGGWVDLLTGAGHQVIGIDGRGNGKSQYSADPAFFRNGPCVRDIDAVLDARGIEKTNLYGYSMGSGHALRYALAHPERVRSVVMGGTGGGALAFAGLYYKSAMFTRQRLCQWLEGVSALLAQIGQTPQTQAHFKAYAEALQQDALEYGDLEGLTVPFLLVVGSEDNTQGEFGAASITEMLARRIPNSRRIVFDRVGHMEAGADPRFREAVLSFLAAQRI